MGKGEEMGRGMERVTWKLTLPYIKQPKGICCMAQETQTGVLYQSREVGREMGGRFKREGIYVYLWLIHVEV